MSNLSNLFRKESKRNDLLLLSDEYELRQYRSLVYKLRSFDWFEFTDSGAIIAHKKEEPKDGYLHGTVFVVPERIVEI